MTSAPDIIEIGGIKYQKVREEPKKPKTLKELFEIYVEYGDWKQPKHVIAEELVNIVRELIPEPVNDDIGLLASDLGYNRAIRQVKANLK